MELNQLLSRRVQLNNELALIEEAIANFGNASPVKIQTRRNLRHNSGLTTDPEEVGKFSSLMVLVFADRNFTKPANQSDFGGYISSSDWSKLKLEYEHWADYVWEVAEG